jgi:alpha-L-fucosidase 2
LALLLASAAFAADAAQNPAELKLWYMQPARQWVEALPIGNGRLGGMVFGTIDEHIQFNESTLWTGKPQEYQHEGAAAHLAAIRQLLSEGKQREAEALATKEFMSVPMRQKAYQPFGDLRVSMPGHAAASAYSRELDLNTGIAKVSYILGDLAFEREAFVSYPDQVLVLHFSTAAPGMLTLSVQLTSLHKTARSKAAGDCLALLGDVEDGGTKFEARVKVIVPKGRVEVRDDKVLVEEADSATLVLCAATSFSSYKDIGGDPSARCESVLKSIGDKSYQALRTAHIEDHQRLFKRVSLQLGSEAPSRVPTDERIKAVAKRDDPQLAALHYQYGRYLLIASSRRTSEKTGWAPNQPANLQGLWNDQLGPPWDSKWTVNINTEMNYWPAESTNLSECTAPLFEMIKDCSETGSKTAKAHYGAGGWVLHHNTDLWRGTAPINASNHGIWVTGGAWLCQHLWEHYLYTGDKDFLSQRAYPLMKGASQFFAEFLVKDPKTGWLISTPSNSPEQGGLVAGPAMDHQIIRALLANTAEAAQALGVDAEFAAKLKELHKQIAPDQIGKHGQLQEWLEDKDDPKKQHRHCSHLWALFPGSEITPATPKLFDAAKQSLIFRGDGGTGWSKAWKINFWARLQDGDHSHKMLSELLAHSTLPNLFDTHPPFQIDGNFGATSGVTEMLLQSHDGSVHLLPALPKAWPSGSVKGLCARGGFEVDIEWTDGKLTEARLRSKLGRPCALRYGEKTLQLTTEAGKSYVFGGGLEQR